MTDNTDPHAVNSRVQGSGIIGYWKIGTARIVRVIAGNRLQHNRAVFGSPRHRPTVIEGERVRDHTFSADPPTGRHEPGDAAERSRVANRSAGVCPQCSHHQSGGHSGRRTRARTAGESMFRIPRVPYGRPSLVQSGAAMSEFQSTEIAHTNCAAILEAAHGSRVIAGNMINENPRVGGSSNAPSFDQVFQTDRYAVQRAAVLVRGNFSLGYLGLAQRFLVSN